MKKERGKIGFGEKKAFLAYLLIAFCFLATLLTFAKAGKFHENKDLAQFSISGAADIAELFPVAYPVEAGDVVCLNDEGMAAYCDENLDVQVLGVVSTAPAIILKGDHIVVGWQNNGQEAPIALKGRVPVKVNCGSPIRIGNLLAASNDGGYAIKKEMEKLNMVERVEKMEGTTIGKALENCEEGEKKIMVWID